MSTISVICQPGPAPLSPVESRRWYAIHTRSQHEKKVAASLETSGIETFLPVVEELRRWSDRCKIVQLPLFSCYVFVRIGHSPESRLAVLRTSSVLGIVSSHGVGLPIPNEEIEGVKMLLAQNIAFEPYPFLAVGQRVRICGGALEGLEGVVVGNRGNGKLLVSVNAIQRSLAIGMENYAVTPI